MLESKLPELGGAIAGSEQLSVQETPPKLSSLPPDSQKVTSAIMYIMQLKMQSCVGTQARLGYAAFDA